MKKSLLFIVPLFALGWFLSCSTDSGVTNVEGGKLYEKNAVTEVEKASKLPACEEKTANQLYYLAKEQEFRYCNGVDYLPVGMSGIDGIDGAKGEKGDVGADGRNGTDGATGEKGEKGDSGTDGISCFAAALEDGSGVKIICADGSEHIILNGTAGRDGNDGLNGEKGDQGETGATGDKGDKGDTGATGSDGEKGDKGDQGEKGDTGATGDKGDQGDKGDPGDKGETGATGADGTPCTGRVVPEGIEISCGGVVIGIIRHGDQGSTGSSNSSSEGSSCSSGEPAGIFTDTRDGKTYNWVRIGDQIWMAENLNFGTRVAGSAEQTDATASSAEKYCYTNDEANCDTYGGLYQWHSAMALPYSCNEENTRTDPCIVNTAHQGICPEGWHVPTHSEWCTLKSWVDEDNDRAVNNNEGTSLKSTTGWSCGYDIDGSGTDAYGWNGLPGGSRSGGSFYNQGNDGRWWSASEYNANDAWGRDLHAELDFLGEGTGGKGYHGFSVRCIKDSPW